MAGARPHVEYAPRLLRRERAAAYVGISPGQFDRYVRDQLFPPAKKVGSVKAWDRADLDSVVDHLPYAEPDTPPDTSWED
jgi:prophage regulatory protein